jgi:polyvinyl alcohol dehydrogenase (cytochrome)
VAVSLRREAGRQLPVTDGTRFRFQFGADSPRSARCKGCRYGRVQIGRYAFDPDARGKILWKVQVGKGGSAIPIWGPAADADKLYVATAGTSVAPPNLPGGLTAVTIANGNVAWHTSAPTPPCAWGDAGCVHTQPAAVTLIPGAVLSGSDDGHMRAYAAKDGAIIWDVDTAKTYDGVNGVVAYGGNIDGAAQTVAGGTLFVNSGNASLTSPHRGDAVLAFTIDGK